MNYTKELLKQNGISRKPRVVLNGQNFSWAHVEARFSQGSILGLLLFSMYNNDLPDNLASNSNLLANNISLFSVVKGISSSEVNSNEDLAKRIWLGVSVEDEF